MNTVMLRALAERYGSDKAVHDYCEPYEQHLGYLIRKRFTLLEIGVAAGGSLRMWRDYFPRANVVGIDRNPHTMIHDEPRIRTVCDDASIPRPWRRFPEQPTVVIDDGSHAAEEVVGAWTYTWPLLAPGGWYAIEDLGAQYCREYGGSDLGGSAAIDLVNRLLSMTMRAAQVTEFHAYREVVLLRKAQ